VSIALKQSPELASPVGLPERLKLVTTAHSAEASAEVNRWAILMGIPFILSALFFMGAIATGREWLIGGSLFTGPGLLVAAVIYLGMSSDTNGTR
jgi:hypothetical protein